MLNYFKKDSILHYLVFMGVVSAAVLFVGFMFIFVNIGRQTRDNEVLADYLEKLNEIHSAMYELKSSAMSLSRNEMSDDDIIYHAETSQSLQKRIDSFQKEYRLSSESRNTLRRLSDFNSYQQKLIRDTANGQQMYFNGRYVSDAVDAHLAEFYHMVKFELDRALARYSEKEMATFVESGVVMAFLFISIAIAFVAYCRFSLSIRNSIHNTISNLHSIARHEWTVEDLPEHEDFTEFQQLSMEVNHEKKELQKYFREIQAKKELEVKLLEQERDVEITKKLLVTTEMEMLKNQINPHFIFNSLHQIGMATLLKEPEDVLQMVEYTGNILRYSLYNKDALVNLEEELYIVRQYIGLQQICMPGSVELKINDEVEDMNVTRKVLPMCIQPIVENSIKHAGGEEDRCLHIEITMIEMNGELLVSISDDGPGTADVEHVLEKSKKSIGLKNISRRMSITYGREDLMQIESEEGRYFRITLEFPQMDETDERTHS